MVAITLDDGPHKTLTARAMDAFEKYGGRGTFFQLGEKMDKNPDVVKDVYERGHEVASHTYSHAQLTKLDAAKLDEEIKKTQDACFKITGSEPTLVRPPYGLKNDTVKNALNSYDLTMILWDGDTEDWRYKDPDYLVKYVLENVKEDSIILFHDIHKTSVEAIEKLLPYLYIDGYQLVTISDLANNNGITLEAHKSYRYFS